MTCRIHKDIDLVVVNLLCQFVVTHVDGISPMNIHGLKLCGYRIGFKNMGVAGDFDILVILDQGFEEK